MNKYFVDSEIAHVILSEGTPDEAWVDVKALLSIGDQDTLSQKLLDVTLDTSNPEGLSRSERKRRARQSGAALNASFKPSTVALLEVAIVAWSFADNEGNKIPVTAEWIAKLKPEWANQIEEEIDSRNPLAGPTTPSNTETPSKDVQLHFQNQPSAT